MKVFFIANNLNTDNGVGRYAREITREIEKRRVTSITLTKQELSSLGRNVNSLFTNGLRVRRESKDFNIVHALAEWPYAFYGFIAVLGTSKKLFVTAHGTYGVVPLMQAGKGFLMRIAYSRSNAIFCVSEYTKTQILKLQPKARAVVIRSGTTILPNPSLVKITEVTDKFRLPGMGPIVLTVGAIKHRKGQLDTLKALNLLRGKYPKFLYLIVGDSSDREYVESIKAFSRERGIEENVRIISNLDDETLTAVYSVADIFALNSNNDEGHFEGFGLVILEAGQFGVPAVGSRDCGIEDAIIDCETGYLTRQGDHKDIAEKIEKIIVHRNLLTRKVREFVKEFSWEDTVKEYIKYYNER